MKKTIYASILIASFIINLNLAHADGLPSQCQQFAPLLEQYNWNVTIAAHIMFGESSCNINAVNASSTTHDMSIGLFQVNTYGVLSKTRPSAEWLSDPANNIAYAYKLYSTPLDPASSTDTRIAGFTPWITQLAIALKDM